MIKIITIYLFYFTRINKNDGISNLCTHDFFFNFLIFNNERTNTETEGGKKEELEGGRGTWI